MIRPPLTDQTIKAMRPPEKGYRIQWDGTLKGFGCRISQAGTKAFVVLIASGRPQTIGRYPDWTLGAARAEAKKRLATKHLRPAPPARTAFDDVVAEFLNDRARHCKSWTVFNYRRWLTRHFPFGRRAIADIAGRDVILKLNAIAGESEREHSFRVLRTLFRYAERQYLIDRSPLVNVQPPPNGKNRERVLTEDELKAVCATAHNGQTTFHRIVAFLCLTGQRRGEIAALQWDWINEDERTICIPSTATKNARQHVFPYRDEVQALLNRIPRYEASGGLQPYLFPAARKRSEKTTVVNGFSKKKARFDLECGVIDWTLHDLRRTYSSTMAALGVPQVVVEKLLNHVSGGALSPIASVYNRHAYMNEMRDAVLRYEAYLTTLIAPTA